MTAQSTIRELTELELEMVTGGSSDSPPADDMSDVDKVRANARTAVDTCGAGNVKSVTTTGFTCKD